MRIFKSHPLLKLVNSYLIDSPQPSNISYLWNFGSLLAVCLVIQIITGVTLAMHYNPSVLEAFNSVEHIMRDVNNGWLIRYLHSNTAAAFFFLVYLHIGRGLYYGSYRAPRTLVWTLGTVIFLLMMATAFLGFLNIAQNGFNSIQQISEKRQKQEQQQLQLGFLTHNLESSVFSLVFKHKADNVLKTKEYANLSKYDKPHTFSLISGKRHYNVSYSQNGANLSQGLRYYSTKNCTKYIKLDSIIIYDLLLEYDKKLRRSVHFVGKLGMPADEIFDISSYITDSVIALKKLENSSFKTSPNTFELIFTLYRFLYVIWIEPNLKRQYSKEFIRSSYMVEFEKKVDTAIKNYRIEFEKVDTNKASCTNSTNISIILDDFILEKNLKPVYIYEDLNNISIHKKLFTETKGLSGIYLILNKVTLDYYIGSASTNRINKRFANHLIHLTGSKVLKNAVRKYKLREFAFLVLEIFPEIVTAENNRKLLDLEDFYLKSLLPNYNILTEAGSSFGYKHSELIRIKMKNKYSQERRDKIGSLNGNNKFSAETIELMREKALNRVKPVYYEQALLLRSPANMKKASKPIIVYNLDRTIFAEYPSITETAKN